MVLEAVSAFAVYSGTSKKSVSRNQKRRLKAKEQKRLKENVTFSTSDEKISLDISNPKKSSKKKRKNTVLESQMSLQPDMGNDLKSPKKKKKKVSIVSPELSCENSIKLNKPIVCTPRFVKKWHVTNDCGNKKQVFGTSPSKILNQVDEYLTKKNEIESRLSNIDNDVTSKDQRSFKDIELAQLARSEIQMKSSDVTGKYCLEKILEPVSIDTFIRENWEKAPVHIPGGQQKQNNFSRLISTEMIDAVLREKNVSFGKHIDVTSYTDGKRETHNLEGRANAHVVWDFYSNGCSVRFLNPQHFFRNVHVINAALQEYFGCLVGANSYLTPPMSQGFAPHYDDIEAFILQIEGSKIWKLYQPMDKDGYLPRYSSRNLLEEEIGEPIMEVKLKPGDILYFPRGYIHQGRTEEEHSLHLTVSVYQKTSWCDLLEKLLPLTLKKAASQDLEFRKGLPIGYLKSAGLVYKNSPTRKDVVKKLKKLITRLNDFIDTDAAIDQMGLSFIHDALPPSLTIPEAACTVYADGWKMRTNGNLQNQVIITPDTKVRWIRAFCYRILEEEVILEDETIEKQIRIYHTLENTKQYHEVDPQFLIVDPSMLPSLHHLTSVYPNFTKVSELPSDNEDEKVLLVSDLWDRGLLMTDAPLESLGFSKSVGENKEMLTAEELKILSDLEEKIPKGENIDFSLSSSDNEIDESNESSDEESIMISDGENCTEVDSDDSN